MSTPADNRSTSSEDCDPHMLVIDSTPDSSLTCDLSLDPRPASPPARTSFARVKDTGDSRTPPSRPPRRHYYSENDESTAERSRTGRYGRRRSEEDILRSRDYERRRKQHRAHHYSRERSMTPMTPRPKVRSGHTDRHYFRYDYEDYYEDRSRSPRPSSSYQRTPSPRKGSKRTLRPHQHHEEEHHSSRRLSASRPRKPVRDVSRSPSTDGPYQRTRSRHPRDRDERRDR
ncbi:hypothetical protein ANCDUO_26483, partial [Ancylostoma duodenale]